jgi:glycosyltransferase involved in cell wall biosynthesis
MSLSIDIIVPTQNRSSLLRRCLLSLFAAARNAEISVRVLVCASGADPGTRREAEKLQSLGIPVYFEWVEKPLSAAASRNRLLKYARAEWLFFIDDDAYVDPDFFLRFLNALENFAEADVIGGPNLTPPNSDFFQNVSGTALSSRFAAANSAVRYTIRDAKAFYCGEESLILCDLFVRRHAMADIEFPEHLVCNEENWLLQDLAARKCQMVYAPQIFVWHERRPNLKSFAIQVHRYGIGRGQNLRQRPRTARLFHVLPSACLLVTLAALAAGPTLGWTVWAWLILAGVYSSVLFILAWRLSLAAGMLIPLIHFAYGLGVLRGLVKRT